jgi:hypothetical protein
LRVICGRGIAAFGCGDFRGGWARGSRSWVAAGAVYTTLLIVVEICMRAQVNASTLTREFECAHGELASQGGNGVGCWLRC